jgi:hypothetical protein
MKLIPSLALILAAALVPLASSAAAFSSDEAAEVAVASIAADPKAQEALPSLRGAGMVPTISSASGGEAIRPRSLGGITGGGGGGSDTGIRRNLLEVEDQTCYISVKPGEDDVYDQNQEVPCTSQFLGVCKGSSPCDVSQKTAVGSGSLFCSTGWRVMKNGKWYCEWKWQCCDP